MKILTGKSLADIYEKNRLAFLEIERQKYAPTFDRGNLEERFTDSKGGKWYGFREVEDLPLARYARLREFLAYMASGLTGDEIRQLVEAGDAALTAGIKTGKNAARIGLIFEELKSRTQLVLHHELILNFMAVQLVINGEDPVMFQPTIHREKVEILRQEAERGGPAFFLHLPELKILRDTWKMSSEDWRRFWRDSQAAAERLTHVLKIVSSADVSSASGKIRTQG